MSQSSGSGGTCPEPGKLAPAERAMGAGGDSGDGGRRILRLSPDCDPTLLHLTAEEGFLLSRIDGHTPWRVLREIGGMEAEEADLCLEGWLASGLVKAEGLAPPEKPRSTLSGRHHSRSRRNGARTPSPGGAGGSASSSAKREIDESLLDAGLDLDVETQRRILTFELSLDRSYFELLGVDKEADAKLIKRAYFKLSKEFHPDRYFRKSIGIYAERLDFIFKRVLEAYEILSDPKLRAELAEASLESPPPKDADSSAAPTPAPPAPEADAVKEPPRKLTKLERLQQRMPFKIPQRLVDERRQKAVEFFKAAQQSERMGRFVEAASSARIAICFDPYNADYRSVLVDLQAKSAESRASELLENAKDIASMSDSELKLALKLLEEVLLYRPHDPAINHRAAEVALEIEQLKKAFEYAQTSVEHCPEVAAYHTTLGLVYRAKADIGHAKNEFEQAVALDGGDTKAAKALASLKVGRRAATNGGRNG